MFWNARLDFRPTHYDLGEIIHAKELTGGFCNHSFAITARMRDRKVTYLVRRYNPRTAEKEIKFEHALVSHLKKNGFSVAAGVIPQLSGGTYVNEKLAAAGRTTSLNWAVFEYLEGDDRYTWIDTHIAPDDMISAARVLAQLHLAGCDFRKPPGTDRVQPGIMDFLPTFGGIYAQYARKAAKTSFDRCFLKHLKRILSAVDQTLISKSDLDRMPQLPIHCDYHQGNLKYKGSEVTGVFDFNWSKIDLRLFDLGLALVYFCARWDGRAAGSLDLDKCELFLKTYNDACALKDGPGPLSSLEKTRLPSLLAAGNLFVMHWTIFDFYTSESPDVEVYMKFLSHGLGLMNWIEAQKDKIRKAVDPF
jgi:homoserine kinase type II